jgi:hypothetical protein
MAVWAKELVFIETKANFRHDVIPRRSIGWDGGPCSSKSANRTCGAGICRYARVLPNVRWARTGASSNRPAIP